MAVDYRVMLIKLDSKTVRKDLFSIIVLSCIILLCELQQNGALAFHG